MKENVTAKSRYVTSSWTCYDKKLVLAYITSFTGQKVVKVSPEHTTICGAIDRHSRDKSNHVFKYSLCSCLSDNDRISTMNLYQLGDGGYHQSPGGATLRSNTTERGRSNCKERNACTTGQSQAHRPSTDG